jgi:hypothetical protein
MAVEINPTDAGFVSDVRLPHGRYKGRTLCEVASTENGLMYLDNIRRERPPFLTRFFVHAIEAFMGTPERVDAIDRVQKAFRAK